MTTDQDLRIYIHIEVHLKHIKIVGSSKTRPQTDAKSKLFYEIRDYLRFQALTTEKTT